METAVTYWLFILLFHLHDQYEGTHFVREREEEACFLVHNKTMKLKQNIFNIVPNTPFASLSLFSHNTSSHSLAQKKEQKKKYL